MAQLNRAATLVELARNAALKITTAESCTGGLLAGAITAVPGASDVFERGFVTYSNEAKIEMLAVQSATLNEPGAVSEMVALEMARGALIAANADIAMAITGIAGPGGSENKPEGRVCFAIVQKDQPGQSETVEFGAIGRNQVRAHSVRHGLDMLITALS